MSYDYTVRFNNRRYQLHKPALPGFRTGRVIMEQRLDGSLAIRCHTPAEPYPSAGIHERTQNTPYRPPANHPWKEISLSQNDLTTGHF